MRTTNTYDVIVAGGGLAGCAAAIAAAETGASTLLIERGGFLGGWATAALVNPFMTHRTSEGVELVAGIFERIRGRLANYGALLSNGFDPEWMKITLDELVMESGADLRLHTWLRGVRPNDDAFTVETLSKSGSEEFFCRRLIDCSGDGDAAVFCGAEYESGDENGAQQSVTTMFDMGGVDLRRAIEYVRDHPDQFRFPRLRPEDDPATIATGMFAAAGYYDLVASARANNEYHAPGDLVFFIARPAPGQVSFNTTHVGAIDGANADDLTRAEIEGRRQAKSVAAFARKHMPGFENAYLLRLPAHVGVRETRRIVGDYRFSEDDVAAGRKFDDCICRLAYPVDVHSGKGDGYTRSEERSRPQAPPPGDWYEIPYRCLLAKGVENLLTAGRCVSSSQAGHGAIRIMPACVATGEAAGVAAAVSLRANASVRAVDTSAVVSVLRERGALPGR